MGACRMPHAARRKPHAARRKRACKAFRALAGCCQAHANRWGGVPYQHLSTSAGPQH